MRAEIGRRIIGPWRWPYGMLFGVDSRGDLAAGGVGADLVVCVRHTGGGVQGRGLAGGGIFLFADDDAGVRGVQGAAGGDD